MFGNWPGFDRFFPDDFYNFQYPQNFHSGQAVNDIRKKRELQNRILADRELLENALNRNDNKNLPVLANNLASSKQKLADLSKSSSSLEIIDQADQTLNKYKKSLVNPHRANTSKNIPITTTQNEVKKNKKNKKKKRNNADNNKVNKNIAITKEGEDIPVVVHNMDIDNNEESNNASNINENINDNANEDENINKNVKKNVNESTNDNDINSNSNYNEDSYVDNTAENANENIENDIAKMDVDIDNNNEINKEKEKQEEEETIKKIEGICDNTKESLDRLKVFSEKSNQLLKELQSLKKEYYDLDTTIFNAILDLDKIKTHGKAKELRKKTLAYYTSALKQLDECVQPLNEFDLKFKSKV